MNNFYDKHQNYKPYLRFIDYEGNEVKFCDVVYDYEQFYKEELKQIIFSMKEKNFRDEIIIEELLSKLE